MKPIFDPEQGRMKIAVAVSGSGTNYERVREELPDLDYLVISNKPDCQGVQKAHGYEHPVLTLDSDAYQESLGRKFSRRGPDRDAYDMAIAKLIEQHFDGNPDLICLAGYDLWLGDWIVNRYYPCILNVHPGDATKGYKGLHHVPSAKALLAGEEHVKSTLFFVDTSDDGGPIFVQSAPVSVWHDKWAKKLEAIMNFASRYGTKTWEEFLKAARSENPLVEREMEYVAGKIQGRLKEEGDWKIYPFAVRLINEGRVDVINRTVYIDGQAMPKEGYQMKESE